MHLRCLLLLAFPCGLLPCPFCLCCFALALLPIVNRREHPFDERPHVRCSLSQRGVLRRRPECPVLPESLLSLCCTLHWWHAHLNLCQINEADCVENRRRTVRWCSENGCWPVFWRLRPALKAFIG